MALNPRISATFSMACLSLLPAKTRLALGAHSNAAGKLVVQPTMILTELTGVFIEQFGRHIDFHYRRPVAVSLPVDVG